MNDKHHPYMRHDFQDPASKKLKRIASVVYVCLMAFIMAGTYLHQQPDEGSDDAYFDTDSGYK